MNKFESMLFNTLFRDPESDNIRVFRADMEQLLNTPKELLLACLDLLPSVKLANNLKERQNILKSFAVEQKCNYPEISSTINILLFFLGYFLGNEESVEDTTKWENDLKTAEILTNSESLETFRTILSSLKNIANSDVRRKIERIESISNFSPSFLGCSISVSMLGIYANKMSYGMSADEYDSEIKDLIPIATVSIRLDMGSDNEKDIVFHAEESDLDNLINVFKAAKKDIHTISDYLNYSNE